MELLQKQQHDNHNRYRVQAQSELFDFVGEMLSISLEKYDTEVVIESDHSLIGQESMSEISGVVQTEIDFEEVFETKDKLEITLSGNVKGQWYYEESFVLFFSIQHDPANSLLHTPDYRNEAGVNTLCLQFGRKAEQISDLVFRVSWLHEDSNGRKHVLSHGKGILAFGRGQRVKAN